MNTRLTAPTLTLLIAASTPGCYSTWDLTPEMVWKLNGFDGTAKKLKVVENNEAKEISFTSDSYLRFHDGQGPEVSAQFRSLQIDGPVLVGIDKTSGEQLNVDLRRIKMIQASELSTGKSAGVAVAYTLGLVPLGFGLAFGIVFVAGGGGGMEGRPLRKPGQSLPIAAPLMVRGVRHGRRRWSPTNESTQARLFARWAKAATEECASIPAFLALARDLTRASAPASLVRKARQAAREEVSHTRLCTNLANQYTNTLIETSMPSIPGSVDFDQEALLRRLALEAFWDGCMGEGVAATAAQASVHHAKDEATRLALQTIAHDEANHAALARDILVYCLSVGGRPVRHALLESLERRRADEEASLEATTRDANDANDDASVDWDLAQRYGMASAKTSRAARIETWEKSVGMLAQVMRSA